LKSIERLCFYFSLATLVFICIFQFWAIQQQKNINYQTIIFKKKPIIIIIGKIEQTKASWYGTPDDGRIMANGKIFDKEKIWVCAHTRLPLGSIIRVRNKLNNKTIVCAVEDRMPRLYEERGRSLDVSEAGAKELGMIKAGVVPVEIWVLKINGSEIKDGAEWLYKRKEIFD
jgi:rare lipoprotein A (peptidoglycan hydrolase)